MSSSYRLALDRWLAELDVNSNRVLDIGGAQLPVKGRTRSWQVESYTIADLPQPHKDSPQPDITLDLNESKLTYDSYGKYDMIFCLEVMDYVWDPVAAFRFFYNLLEPFGTAWVSFPSLYPAHQPIDDDALRYMPAAILKLAKYHNFVVAQMIPRRTETDAIYQAFRTERMRCAKHIDHNVSGYICAFQKIAVID